MLQNIYCADIKHDFLQIVTLGRNAKNMAYIQHMVVIKLLYKKDDEKKLK